MIGTERTEKRSSRESESERERERSRRKEIGSKRYRERVSNVKKT